MIDSTPMSDERLQEIKSYVKRPDIDECVAEIERLMASLHTAESEYRSLYIGYQNSETYRKDEIKELNKEIAELRASLQEKELEIRRLAMLKQTYHDRAKENAEKITELETELKNLKEKI